MGRQNCDIMKAVEIKYHGEIDSAGGEEHGQRKLREVKRRLWGGGCIPRKETIWNVAPRLLTGPLKGDMARTFWEKNCVQVQKELYC